MVYSANDCVLITVLRREKGYGVKRTNCKISQHLNKLLRKVDTDSTLKGKHGSGWNLEADGQQK